MIKFASQTEEREFNSYHLDIRVRNIALFIAGWAEYILDFDMIITSVFRNNESQEKNKKNKEVNFLDTFDNVHSNWRALDFVLESKKGGSLSLRKSKNVEELINKYIQHDNNDEYLTCVYTNSKDMGNHFHIQVSSVNQTKFRGSNG